MDNEDLKYWNGIIRGDLSSFELLYKEYFKLLFNYGKKLCSSQETVEDAIHDLFVDLWRYRKSLSHTTSVRFYLYRCLRRKLAKNGSSANLHSELDLDSMIQLHSISKEREIIEAESRNQRVHRLSALLENLSSRQHEAVVLYFYCDCSYEEIASIMNVNSQSVRNLVQRGLIQMRQLIRHAILFFPIVFLVTQLFG